MKWRSALIAFKATRLLAFKNGLQQTGMITSMPGIYSRNFDEGNCRIVEKVSIRQISIIADMYKIVRIRWRRDGLNNKAFQKQKTEKWIATYDCSKRQLEQVDGQLKCSFLPEKSMLFLSNTKLKKIKSF